MASARATQTDGPEEEADNGIEFELLTISQKRKMFERFSMAQNEVPCDNPQIKNDALRTNKPDRSQSISRVLSRNPVEHQPGSPRALSQVTTKLISKESRTPWTLLPIGKWWQLPPGNDCSRGVVDENPFKAATISKRLDVQRIRRHSAKANTNTNGVELPTTFRDYVEIRKEHENDVSYNYPPEIKVICRYSGAAVAANRSCGDVIIMMAGETGSGKSTTINKLFGDDNLCKTGDMYTSETKSVWEVRVGLTINQQNGKTPINTSLVFVDVPGSLDDGEDSTRELNQRLVRNYIATLPSLISRPIKTLDELDAITPCKNRTSFLAKMTGAYLHEATQKFRRVFPNLILLAVNGTSNRIAGKNANLPKTLRLLKELQVLDLNRLNLIIFVSHAGSLSRTKYIEKTQEISEIIHKHLVDVFATTERDAQRLRDTKIIFIENQPDEHDLKKQEGIEFYLLPDKTVSHFNLIQAMTDTFRANGDLLGSLACGWYFGKGSSEQKMKVHLSEALTYDNLSPYAEDIASIANRYKTSEARQIEMLKLQMVRELPLQFIGHGYCPCTEIHKSNLVLRPEKGNTSAFRLSNNEYVTHSQLSPTLVHESKLEHLTRDTKESYENRRAKDYGFESDMHLTVMDSVNTFGKWKTESDESVSGIKMNPISFLFEKRILFLGIDELKTHLSTELLTDLRNLPTECKPNDPLQRAYLDFFEQWGTHFVRESYMGGSIKLISSTRSNHLNLDSEIFNKLKIHFDSYIAVNPKACNSPELTIDLDFPDFFLKFCGGTISGISLLSDLTPEIYQKWIRTVDSNPAELDHCIKLKPYYEMIEDPQRESLRIATAKYLECEIAVLPLTRENVAKQICDSTMNDEYADDGDELTLPAKIGLGIAMVLTFPIWLPFLAIGEGYRRLKKRFTKLS